MAPEEVPTQRICAACWKAIPFFAQDARGRRVCPNCAEIAWEHRDTGEYVCVAYPYARVYPDGRWTVGSQRGRSEEPEDALVEATQALRDSVIPDKVAV